MDDGRLTIESGGWAEGFFATEILPNECLYQMFFLHAPTREGRDGQRQARFRFSEMPPHRP
jgi:hypothetical protein